MIDPRCPAVEVDLDAIRRNTRVFCERVNTPVLAVVKANGYGHGLIATAHAAVDGGASYLGVVDAEEGAMLRAAGFRQPIIVWILSSGMSWLSVFAAELELAVSSLAQLALIVNAAADERRGRRAKPVRVYVKIDSGLGRNGAAERDWPQMFDVIASAERRGLIELAGIMSHFAGAGAETDAAQLAAFDRALECATAAGLSPRVNHIAATRAALQLPEARHELVRLGIGMHGMSAFDDGEDPMMPLEPAMRITAPVYEHPDGSCVIELGTVDGLHEVSAGSITLADDHGHEWQVDEVGEVHTHLARLGEMPKDCTARPRVVVLDPDREEANADAWARAASTINYEITTRFAPSMPRHYLPEAPARHEDAHPWPPLEDPDEPVLAPRRRVQIDLERAEERLREIARRARRRPDDEMARYVDVSAGAYGHGAHKLLPLIRRADLQPIVRTLKDAIAHEQHDGEQLEIVPTAPESTRAVYGFDPKDPCSSLMRLTSELTHVKRVAKGQGVSYGCVWTAPEDTTLGLVPLGYADAIPRAAFGRAQLRVAGHLAPIVGRIAMDQVVVDLGTIDVWPGARVSVFGPGHDETSLAEWARWCGLSMATVTSTFGPRIERSWIGRRA
ncbi:alanine racemase [Pseudoclavibacter alba]|uniref:alanine racemase n=1 Tax=Pseudoclavibacter albus TaxID=272241 RepID=UPI0019CFDB5F|nr:alanine racemase [Pseudoclavibacter alba]